MANQGKVAYVFPGQGAQGAGMGRDLYDNFAVARAVFDQADEVLGVSLSRLCFEGPEDELRQTINAQPAMLLVSWACLEAVRAETGGSVMPLPSFAAGHSLGEYTALLAAGVLGFTDAIYLARERGRLMHEAGLKNPGGMVAIIGFEESSLAEVCRETGTHIANVNCAGQLVISGAHDRLARASELAKARGAYRTIPLRVSGAFHTPLMQPAYDGMTEIIATLPFRSPSVPVIANTTAMPLNTVDEVRVELLSQLCNCIDWQRSVEYMIKEGVNTFVEIGSGRVLSGLIKRVDRSVSVVNIENSSDIRNLQNIFA